jgi:hypothetical protein
MKMIQRLLLSVTYACLLPFGAKLIYDFHTTRIVTYYGLLGVAVIISGLGLLAGYSQAAVGQAPWSRPKIFWASSATYNMLCVFAALQLNNVALLTKGISLRLANLGEAFRPTLKPDKMLGALAGLGFVIAICWMPFAALLSLIAFVITWMGGTKTQGEER